MRLLLDTLQSELAGAARLVGRRPMYAITSMIILGLGVAGAIVLLAALNYYFIQPLPVASPDELVRVGVMVRSSSYPTTMPYEVFEEVRRQDRVFEDAAAYSAGDLSVKYPAEDLGDRRFFGVSSPNYFEMLGLVPAHGRFYSSETEPSGQPPLVLSYESWQRRFHGDESALGQDVQINGIDFIVVGVAPKAFVGTELTQPVDGYFPATRLRLLAPEAVREQLYGVPGHFRVLARLRQGVSAAMATDALRGVGAHLAVAEGPPDVNVRFVVVPESRSRPDLTIAGIVRRMAVVLTALTLALLVMSCMSVINLSVLRMLSRDGELTVRKAIGASSSRLMISSTLEGTIVGLGGFGVGIIAARWVMSWLADQRLVLDTAPSLIAFRADGWVYVAAGALALASGTVAAVLGAVRVAALNPAGALVAQARGTGSGTSARLRRMIIVAQVTASVVLLAAASLLFETANSWSRTDLGFQPAGVSVLSVDLINAGYDRSDGQALLRRWLAEVKTLNGVRTAALTQHVPLGPNPGRANVRTAAHTEPVSVMREVVTPGYFVTLGIPLLNGRDFLERDDTAAPLVAIINQTFADRFFRGRDPIGDHVNIGSTDSLSARVIGVVRDAKYVFANEPATPAIYLPWAQFYSAEMSLLARGMWGLGDDKRVRDLLASLDNRVTAFNDRPLEAYIEHSPTLILIKVGMALTVGMAGLATMQAIVGLFSVLAFTVVRCRKEFGIRMALGATTRRLIMGLTREGILLAMLGVLIAVWPAFAVAQLAGDLISSSSLAIARSLSLAAFCALVVSVAAGIAAGRKVLHLQPMEILSE